MRIFISWLINMKYEIIKLFQQKIFSISLIALLIFHGTMIAITEYPISRAEKQIENIDTITIERFIKYDRAMQSQEIGEIDFEDQTFINEYENKYLSELQPYLMKKYEHKVALDQYDNYIDGVLLFAKEHDSKMLKRYEQLQNIEIEQPINSGGIAVLKSLSPSLALILFAFLIPNFMMHADIENDSFYETLSGGKRKLILSKIFTALLITLIFSVLLSVMSMLVNTYLYGSLSLTLNIQSFMEFIQSPYNITIIQSILIMTLWNCLITFSLVCILLSIWNKFSQATLISAVVLGILVVISIVVSKKSIFAFIHLLNPLSQFNTFANISHYKLHFNILSTVVLVTLFHTGLIVLNVASMLVSQRRIQTSFQVRNKFGFYRNTNIFLQELEFSLFNLKGIVYIILLLSIVGYQWYMDFENSYTPSYINSIQSKSNIFDNESFESLGIKVAEDAALESRLNEMMIQGDIIQSELDNYFEDLNEIRLRRIVYEQMMSGYEVEPTGYLIKYQVNSEQGDLVNMLLFATFLVVFLSKYYTTHTKSAELDVFYSTVNSKKRQYTRYIIGMLYSVVVLLAIYGIQSLMFKRIFKLPNVPVANFLWENSTFNNMLNTNQYNIYLWMSRFLGLYLLTSITYIISKISKSSLVTMALSFAILVLPLLVIATIGVNVSILDISDLILGNRFLNKSTWIVKVPVIMLVSTFLLYKLENFSNGN